MVCINIHMKLTNRIKNLPVLRFRRLGRQYQTQAPGYRFGLRAWRWYPAWVRSLEPGRSPLADRRPWITYEALRPLENMVPRGARVFEFGTGGSTAWFLDRGCRLTSVEHDSTWSERVLGTLGTRDGWDCHCVPPEPLDNAEAGRFRSEFPGYLETSFANYVKSLERVPDASLDLLFVDGRARVDAALDGLAKLKPGGCLVLDNSERERYRPIHDHLAGAGWPVERYAGPGPYVETEFWETTIWRRP